MIKFFINTSKPHTIRWFGEDNKIFVKTFDNQIIHSMFTVKEILKRPDFFKEFLNWIP